MKLFKEQNYLVFTDRFNSDTACAEYLADIKWADGFKCVKCGHTASQLRHNYSRTCNKCSHTESAMANTLFHKVKFGLRKAFFICFDLSTSRRNFSESDIANRFGVTENTARLFMHKVHAAMKSNSKYPIIGKVHIDKLVAGKKE